MQKFYSKTCFNLQSGIKCGVWSSIQISVAHRESSDLGIHIRKPTISSDLQKQPSTQHNISERKCNPICHEFSKQIDQTVKKEDSKLGFLWRNLQASNEEINNWCTPLPYKTGTRVLLFSHAQAHFFSSYA